MGIVRDKSGNRIGGTNRAALSPYRRGVYWRRSALLFLAIFAPLPLIDAYVAGLLVQAYLFAVLAVTVDVVWGCVGMLNFGSSAMFGIGAYALGGMFVHVSSGTWAIPAALAIGVSLASVLSALIGWLAFYSSVKASEFYISIVTLGLSVLFNQTVSYGGALTGGSNGLSGFASVSLDNRVWYAIAGSLLLLAMMGALCIVNSDAGLILRAVRDHETRCRYLGIHTPRLKTIVFTACNGAAAAVGVLYALYSTVVAPSLVGFILATNVLIWVMLGGRATIVGPVIAAVLVNAATPGLSASIPLYWQGALGLVFIFVIVLMPQGLLPGLWTGAMWLLGRLKTGKAEPAALAASGGQRWSARIAPDAGRPLMTPGDLVLEVDRVAKNFGSFQALADVSFHLRCGEVVSVVGPNGAGKTSLVRCICDGGERSGGSVMVCGRPIGRSPPDVIVGLGVGCKFQGASVFRSLTVEECLRIASWKGRMPSMWRRQPAIVLPTAAAEVVERLGLGDIRDRPAHVIGHGQRQALELAMVLALNPRLLVLDEPTAGLTAAERAAVGHLLTQLAARGRLAILLIEHDFDFVKEISTRIVVLHEGRILADGTVAEVAGSRLLKDVYLGRSASRRAP